ncbi:MAG: helix-turn-helix domain-containing protein [Spirochaetes bacterium]|nr:helix-turn-helix domain-containing protein [Spirochaetota bacterium]
MRIERWARSIPAAPFWRFYLPVSGKASLEYGGTSMPLERGVPVLIPPGTAFTTSHRAPFTKLFAHVSITWTGMSVACGIYRIRSAGVMKRCRALVKTLSGNGIPASPMRRWLSISAAVSDAVASLPADVFRYAPYAPRIMTVIERMRLSLANPLPNRALAGLIGMHENSFIRLFRRETGVSPADYYRRERLAAAAELLADPSAVIEDIAVRTGFYDRDHFTRAFTSYYSIPPARYRRMVQGA